MEKYTKEQIEKLKHYFEMSFFLYEHPFGDFERWVEWKEEEGHIDGLLGANLSV